MTLATKFCHGCNTSKPLDAFSRDKSKGGGLSTRCKACKAAYKKTRPPCRTPGCTNPRDSGELCSTCYNRKKRGSKRTVPASQMLWGWARVAAAAIAFVDSGETEASEEDLRLAARSLRHGGQGKRIVLALGPETPDPGGDPWEAFKEACRVYADAETTQDFMTTRAALGWAAWRFIRDEERRHERASNAA